MLQLKEILRKESGAKDRGIGRVAHPLRLGFSKGAVFDFILCRYACSARAGAPRFLRVRIFSPLLSPNSRSISLPAMI